MAIKKIPEFYPKAPGKLDVTVKLSEGTLTVAEVNTGFGTDIGYSFASGVAVGDQLVAAGLTSDGDILLAKRVYNDGKPVVAEVITEPKMIRKFKAAGTYTWGNYEPREATVRFYGRAIRVLKVYLAQSANLAAGEYLKAAAVQNYENCYTEATVSTSRVSLEAVTASGSAASESTAVVLEGYEVETPDVTA